jgi:hypothetical protein
MLDAVALPESLSGSGAMRSLSPTLPVALLTLTVGCGQSNGSAPWNTALNAATHDSFFPIAAGSKHALGSDSPAINCNSCHGTSDTFHQFDCLSCHQHQDQATLDRGHFGISQYTYESASCYACHSRGTAGGALPAGTIGDPARDVAVDAWIPVYADTWISSVSPRTEILPMPMNHASTNVDVTAFGSCGNCHPNAGAGSYYPGDLHSSLGSLNLAQPSACADCHASSKPVGFVGPIATNPARTPSSSEMKHDAVLWSNGRPTASAAVTQDCSVCHLAPSPGMPAGWATNKAGTTPASFHAPLTSAGLPQPASCLDCHANSRPSGIQTLPPGTVQFDHGIPAALADCASCHQSGSASAQWGSWAGGKFHLAGDLTPSSCLPCHAGERPTTTSNWTSTTYTSSPFDYVTNAQGITHGAGQDCAVCHSGPGTGAWGGTQNWAGGRFLHGASTMSASTCIACHASQRPDLQPWTTPGAMATLLGFDHSVNGTGDCFGCHQATVTANRYQYYARPGTTQTLPGGDWQGGEAYPGDTLIGSPSQFVTVTEIDLQRSGPNNLVTGTTSTSATLWNQMLHVSTAVRPEVSPGAAATPDYTKCWHCHTSTGTTVTSFANGQFHPALAGYSATPGGTPTPLPQPTSQCLDCHAQMRPAGIVERAASILLPMDHNALFTSAVIIGGVSVTGVAGIECAVCHKNPGNTWTDGIFHANIGTAVPQDCTVCHYPLMADPASSDVSSGASYTMKHASTQLTFQNCQACHTAALSKSKSTPIASTLWQPGAFHPRLATQPSACVVCHAVSEPAANSSTQSSVTYGFALGGTSTNAAQWMNHGSGSLAGKDCYACHAADAKISGSAWSRSDSFHAQVASPASCRECHGLTNGGGSVPGTNNNLPAGLTNSSAVTSAAADPSTGVPAGTHDQITHADLNVTSHDCNFCHTQQGVSTVAGVQGKEWAQAAFHASFTTTNPLLMNGTTGRCSACHMNVKPAAGFAFDHSSFTAASGSQDCASCHTWPGTGTPTAPNWLGAAAAPAIVTLTPWSSGTSITSKTVTFAHPRPNTYTSCAQCHAGTSFSTLIDYNHDGLTSNVTINGVVPSSTPNLGTSAYNATTNPTFCVHCHNTGSPWISRTGLTSTLSANTTSGSTTVTAASTSALTLGMTVTGTGIPNATTTTTTFTASTTSGSTTVTTSAPVSLSSGTAISGPGIPANDTVATSVNNATSFTLRMAATATATGVTLTATRSSPLTVTIRAIPSATSFTISSAANATIAGTTLSVTHVSTRQAAIGNHQGSTNGQDCTSCHYVGGRERLTPPTPGVFGTGSISGG